MWPFTKRTIRFTGLKDFFLSMGDVLTDRYGGGSKKQAYLETSLLTAVVGIRSRVFRDARPYVTTAPEAQGETATSPQSKALRDRLRWANTYQSGPQWYVQKEILKNIYGYALTWLVRPTYLEAPQAMVNLIPGDYELNLKADARKYTVGKLSDVLSIRVGGIQIDVDRDLIIWNDDNTGFDMSWPMLSTSRLESIMNETNLARFLSEAQKVVVTKRGAVGIFSREGDFAPPGIFADDKQNLEKAFSEFGLSEHQMQILVTGLNYKFNPVTWPTKDLMLIEFDELVAKKVCGVYDVPYQLLPMSGQSTYENAKQAKIDLYQGVAIPTSMQDAELLARAFNLPEGEYLYFDYSHVPVLAEDLQRRASAIGSISTALSNLFDKNLITRKEARSELSRYTDINAGEPDDEAVNIDNGAGQTEPTTPEQFNLNNDGTENSSGTEESAY